MSTHITSDCTILAIVSGMRRYGMISYRDRYFMAGALRAVNEEITWKVWQRDGVLFTGLDMEHRQVDWNLCREFTDEEIWQSCKCWLYQVSNNVGVSLDFVTIIGGVRQLKQTIERKHLEDKSWKCKCWFGEWHFFNYDEEADSWNDIAKQIEWDLAA